MDFVLFSFSDGVRVFVVVCCCCWVVFLGGREGGKGAGQILFALLQGRQMSRGHRAWPIAPLH